jgi:methionyl-tRNA formyltransferase
MPRASAIVFAYHNVGVRCLSVLLAQGIDVRMVVTHEDRPGEKIWFDSVARLAQEQGLPVITPDDPNLPEVAEALGATVPDFLFSFYYRQMLRLPLLSIPRRGAYNMHGSLLPKYRGRTPVNWAILHGERETGATLHAMTEKPDNGAIVDQFAVPILPDDTAREVFDKVTLAAELTLHRCLPGLVAGTAALRPQDLSQGAYFGGRSAEDGRIDWNRPAGEIHNLVRAVTDPYPGAFSDLDGGRLMVWRSRVLPDGSAGSGAPALLVRDGRLLARCGGDSALLLLRSDHAGTPLDAGGFQARYGAAELPLNA